MSNISILYFGVLASQLGKQSESLELDANLQTISDLKDLLEKRGAQWHTALRNSTTKCAVNQELADDATPIAKGNEVAFFPPVTGG